MNIGGCPYHDCAGLLFVPVPDKTPAFTNTTCDDCGRPVWYRVSRVDPAAFTPAEFDALYRIDEETKTITPRNLGGC